MVLVFEPRKADELMEDLREAGETVNVVGQFIERQGAEGCVLKSSGIVGLDIEAVYVTHGYPGSRQVKTLTWEGISISETI